MSIPSQARFGSTLDHELIVDTDPENHVICLRLKDADGKQWAYREVRVVEHSAASWQGIFDTRRYVESYKDTLLEHGRSQPLTDSDLVKKLGVFLGIELLGQEMMSCLTETYQQRTLIVRVPATDEDALAAAMARVPWEIARRALDSPTLMERNLVVRMVPADAPEPNAKVAEVADRIAREEALRVLLVFAEAQRSRPLAMRQERERLLDLFYREILPQRNVQVDVLCHGVTRAALQEQVTVANGYHLVHWSGHGHHNCLELRGEDGGSELLTGEQLVTLFVQAGGFFPQVVFLSACLSGTFVGIRDWAELQAAIRGERQQPADDKRSNERRLPDVLGQTPGYAGTALALLRSGVPQVIAMRYEVGDDYARELAWLFYKRLLADAGKRPTESALVQARNELLQTTPPIVRFGAVDHATPVMFGHPGRVLNPLTASSPQMDREWPRPQPLLHGGNHDLEPPRNFVGRGEQLAQLVGRWLTREGPAVALIQGLAGLGKTALAAEALHLWHRRFDWVLGFQAKPTPLTPDDFFRQIDHRLTLESSVYRNRCESSPSSKVFLEPDTDLTGDARYERLRTNLLEAMRREAILLVIDNFETNLESTQRKDGYASRDPQWDLLLKTLAQDLQGTRSRVLITSRHRPAALADNNTTLWIPLGPLPHGEIALFIRSHPRLAELFYADAEGQTLVHRVVQVSRGHPLIMDRLANLANDREVLKEALETLEGHRWGKLPDLFASAVDETERDREREYLEDIAIGSIDWLIQRQSPDARRLLWIVTLANEPVTPDLLGAVCARMSVELLDELQRSGLLTKTDPPTRKAGSASDDGAASVAPGADAGLASYSFHELVRERIANWMDAHTGEKGDRTEAQIWIGYGERYAEAYDQLMKAGREGAREAAAELGRRALVYMVRAEAFDRLGSFAGQLVTGTRDPTLLRGVIAELNAVADRVPTGKPRWLLRTYLADALSRSGQPDEALAWYERAVAEAEAAEDWADVGATCMNWANGLRYVGHLDEAKATQLRSAEAYRKAGSPRVNVVGCELEAMRIDVMQGKAEQALPDIEARLDEVRGWWQRQQAGEMVPEAPDSVLLGRALISGLDIAEDANLGLERWQPCLDLLEEAEETKRALGESYLEMALARFNRYGPLSRLGRLDEAQRVLEDCLGVYSEAGDLTRQGNCYFALADVWDKRGDTEKAVALACQALAVCNRQPDPSHRAISHGNLSNYLDRGGKVDEAARHFVASLAYNVATNHQQHLQVAMRNLANRMRRAAQSGGRYELPRLGDVLDLPEFDPLRQFLAQAGVDHRQLQEAIDRLVTQVRE